MLLGLIYHQCKFKDVALTRLARWYDEVDKSGFLAFGRVARSIQTQMCIRDSRWIMALIQQGKYKEAEKVLDGIRKTDTPTRTITRASSAIPWIPCGRRKAVRKFSTSGTNWRKCSPAGMVRTCSLSQEGL